MSASFVPGRYWNVSGKIVIAPSAASAKRFAKGVHNIKGGLSALHARLATEEEISAYISKEPERVADNDRARQAREATERLHAAAPDLLSMVQRAYRLMPLGTHERASWVKDAALIIDKASGRIESHLSFSPASAASASVASPHVEPHLAPSPAESPASHASDSEHEGR